MTEYIAVLVTASKEEEAVHIAKEIVGSKLAACVNIIRDIRSIYSWQGKVEDETEVLMVVKTRADLFEDLMKKIREHHSYSLSEIIALPIVKGPEDYLAWLKDATKDK